MAASIMSSLRSILGLVIVLVMMTAPRPTFAAIVGTSSSFSTDFYLTSCPFVVEKINTYLFDIVLDNKEICPKLLRLHFHDCFVRGCDASILIRSTPSNSAELDSIANGGIGGLEIIDGAKAVVESYCPGKVSCADVLAIAARECIRILSFGTVAWTLPLGRRDGVVSLVGDPLLTIPPPFFNYSQLVQNFQFQGLGEKDMVALSGAHTIGQANCLAFQARLYNSTAPGAVNGVDPTLDSSLAISLRNQCPFGVQTNDVAMDPSGLPDRVNNTFDSKYFKNIQDNKVVFTSDVTLKSTTSGASYVNEFTDLVQFIIQFQLSMTKLSSIDVKTGTAGQIRAQCGVVNS